MDAFPFSYARRFSWSWILTLISTFLCILLSKYLVGIVIDLRYPSSIYETNFIISGLFQAKEVLLYFGISAASWFFHRKLNLDFSCKIENSIAATCVLLILVNTSFMEFNYYFNSAQYSDKVLLIALAIACLRYPSVYIVFVFYSLIIIKQCQFPGIGSFTFTDKRIFYEILLLLWLLPVLFKYTDKSYRNSVSFTAVWVIYATWYLAAGLEKIELGWFKNDLTNLFLASLAYGWLDNMISIQGFIFKFLNEFNDLLLILTILAEIGVILFFLNRKGAIMLLIILFSMHGFIMLSSGIFFWKWMVFILVLIFVVMKYLNYELFGFRQFLFSCALFLLVSVFLNTTRLGWFDTGVVAFHKVELIEENGQALPLQASFFSPYDVIFSQNRFSYLVNRPTLFDTYGAIHDEIIYNQLHSKIGSEDIKSLIIKNGTNRYQSNRKECFDNFLVSFTTSKINNEFDGHQISSPLHIYQGKQEKLVLGTKHFKKVKVSYFEIHVQSPSQLDTLFSDSYELLL